MLTLGRPRHEMFALLVGLLHLGNVRFDADGEGSTIDQVGFGFRLSVFGFRFSVFGFGFGFDFGLSFAPVD